MFITATEMNTKLTDEGFRALSSLNKLEKLGLRNVNITSQVFKYFPLLKSLDLKFDHITNHFTIQIAKNCLELESLSIASKFISNSNVYVDLGRKTGNFIFDYNIPIYIIHTDSLIIFAKSARKLILSDIGSIICNRTAELIRN